MQITRERLKQIQNVLCLAAYPNHHSGESNPVLISTELSWFKELQNRKIEAYNKQVQDKLEGGDKGMDANRRIRSAQNSAMDATANVISLQEVRRERGWLEKNDDFLRQEAIFHIQMGDIEKAKKTLSLMDKLDEADDELRKKEAKHVGRIWRFLRKVSNVLSIFSSRKKKLAYAEIESDPLRVA